MVNICYVFSLHILILAIITIACLAVMSINDRENVNPSIPIYEYRISIHLLMMCTHTSQMANGPIDMPSEKPTDWYGHLNSLAWKGRFLFYLTICL